MVKVSPDSSDNDIIKICNILAEISKTAINIGNSKYVKADEVGLSSKSFSKEGGGLSGKNLYDNIPNIIQNSKSIHENKANNQTSLFADDSHSISYLSKDNQTNYFAKQQRIKY